MLLGLLVSAVLLVFLRVVGFDFLSWDDDIHVTKNPYLNPVSAEGLARFWTAPYENLYVPLSYMFFAGEAFISECLHGRDAPLDPRIFHAGALVLHAMNVLLVFGLLWRLVARPLAAWTGALVFALHPLQVESVAWIGETRGLLGTLFSLVALLEYISYAQRSRAGGSGARAAYVRASLAFIAALLSKPSAVTVPLAAAAIDIFLVGDPLRRPQETVSNPVAAPAQPRRWLPPWTLRALLPWFIAAAAVVIVTKLQQSDARLAFVAPWWARPLVAVDALAFYLGKLVAPLGLGFDYGRSPAQVLEHRWAYFAWLVPLAVVTICSLSRERRLWYASLGVLAAGLLPTLGLVPYLYQDISTVADRYMYFPMLGVAMAVALWLDRHWSLPLVACCGLWLGALGSLSAAQASFWQNDMAVFDRGSEINPRSYIAQYSLGGVYQKQGLTQEAQLHYLAALRLNPHYARAHNDLGVTYYLQGQTDRAIEEFRKALDDMPDYCEAHLGLGNAYSRQARSQDALAEYRRALEINPRSAEAHTNLADELAREGHEAEAEQHLREAIALKPRLATAHAMLGRLLAQRGQLDEAERELEIAVREAPAMATVHDLLGSVCFQRGDLTKAQWHYDAALAIDPYLVEAHFNKGLVFIQLGRRKQALAEFRAALALVPVDSSEAHRIAAELRKYE